MKKYPPKTHEEAFRLFLELGNVNDIAVLMKIRRKTIAKWRKDENWDRHLNELREKRYKQITREVSKQEKQRMKEFVKKHVRETSDIETLAGLFDLDRKGGLDIIGDVLEVRDFYDIEFKLSPGLTAYKDNQPITFTSTPCYFGGERWWFVCPKCERRCYKLYRPYWRGDFACRLCHQLEYRR